MTLVIERSISSGRSSKQCPASVSFSTPPMRIFTCLISERLCGRFERVFFRFTLIHHRSNSPDDVDEETHRNRSADSKNDETDLDMSWHVSSPPAVIGRIVRSH